MTQNTVLYIIDGMDMLPYDAVRKGHSSPLPMGMMTAPGNQKEAGIRQNKRMAEAAAGPDGPSVLGLYLQLCRFYLWGSQAALRGWIVNADFRAATPGQIAAEVGFRDTRRVEQDLKELERIGLLVWAPLPDFTYWLEQDKTHTPLGEQVPGKKQRFDRYHYRNQNGNGNALPQVPPQPTSDDTAAATTANPATQPGGDDRGEAGSQGGPIPYDPRGGPLTLDFTTGSPPADDPGPGDRADDPGPGRGDDPGGPPPQPPAAPVPAQSGKKGGDIGQGTGDQGRPRPSASADDLTGETNKTCRPAAVGTGGCLRTAAGGDGTAGTMPTGDGPTAEQATGSTDGGATPHAATKAAHADRPAMPTEADPGGVATAAGSASAMQAYLADVGGHQAACELAEVIVATLYANRADQVQAMRSGHSDNLEHAVAREAGSILRTCVAARVCLADRWGEFVTAAGKHARKVMKVRKVKKSRGSLWNYEINQWAGKAVGVSAWETARRAARRLTGAAGGEGSVPP